MRSGAFQFAYLWAQVGVALPGEAGLMAASMIPLVGEGMDVHGAIYGETAFERWASRASLGLSGITLGLSPNLGRFARFVGDTTEAMRGLRATKVTAEVSVDAVRATMRGAEGLSDATRGATRLGRNAVMEAAERAGHAAPELKHLKCFVAGTLVKTEAGLTPIEEIEVGDKVWSRDEETGAEGWRDVLELFETHTEELVHLGYRVADETGEGELIGTTGHPFWSLDRREWVPMEDLKAGERLHVAGGAVEAVVTTLRLEQAPAGETFTTFNVEVAGWHTYFVAPKASPPGTATVWVHNMCDARLQELLVKIANNDPRYGERVLASIRGGLKDENQLRRIEAAVDARRLAAPKSIPAEKLVRWMDEGGNLRAGGHPGMRPDAYKFQSGTAGARSGVEGGRSLAPYLEFTDDAGKTIGAKFDGVQGLEVIDRKMNPFFSAKAVDEARRQAAVARHFGLQAVYELPTPAAVNAANRFMKINNIEGITVRLAQ